MDIETKRLIELARFIGRTFGVENERVEQMERCGCTIKDSKETRVFQTPKMIIVVGMDTLEMVINKRENDNPVVMSNAEGNVYRFHGEFAHIVDEINEVIRIATEYRTTREVR